MHVEMTSFQSEETAFLWHNQDTKSVPSIQILTDL